MKKTESQATQVLSWIRKDGTMKLAEIVAKGVHPEIVRRLHANGKLLRISRGLYAMPGGKLSSNESLILATKRISHGVICLLSALQFHQIGTQLPREVWVAIGNKDRIPCPGYPSLKTVRFSGAGYKDGIIQYRIGNVMVPIYCPAKTIVDCFKFRNKIGLDIAMEALRDCLRKKKATRLEIHQYAKLCRMSNVMKPYLEMEAIP